MRRTSIRVRLTAWYAAVVGLVLVVMAAVSYSLLARFAAAQTEEGLADTAATVLASLRVIGAGQPRGERAETMAAVVDRFRYADRRILVYDARAELVAASRLPFGARARAPFVEAPLDPGLLGAVRRGHRSVLLPPPAPGLPSLRALARPVRVGPARYTIVVLGSTRDELRLLAAARTGFLWLVPLAILLAAAIGYFLARKSLAPVLAMTRRASRIGAANLEERLPVIRARDELGELALTLNSLLDRLHEAFAQQRRFMADAAHELRTPVAVIRGEAEVALAREPREEAEYRESLAVVGDEAARLSTIVDDLFMLARVDAGAYPLRPSDLYLDEVVGDAARAAAALAARKGVALEVEAPEALPLRGDEALLRRMVLNLLDNAVKYTAPGGRVEVSALGVDGRSVITVRDTGPGIPAEAQSRIFDRFYRAEATASAEGTTGSAGLGLPIARWIAEAHGGTLRLSRTGPEGSAFTVEIPSLIVRSS